MSRPTTTAEIAPQAPKVPGFHCSHVQEDFAEYQLKQNGLRVIHCELPGTGVVTSNLTYHVGSRDEARGKTGLAHMLEHMLFKPTAADRAARLTAGADRFESETGCLLNANTSRDRTTYYFSYPQEHLDRALAVEADRMQGVVITDENFAPERNNVLSEFDMYFSEPQFVLALRMSGVTFHSHPYGHEVIGFRDDIERYTAADLRDFYTTYYRPDNATLTIIGDVPRRTALLAVKRHFRDLPRSSEAIPRVHITEAPPEGQRTVTIRRPSTQNLLAVGIRHAGFPNAAWYRALVGLTVFADGPESVLEHALVDTGYASGIELMLEPSTDENLAIIFITLAPGVTHETVLARIEQERAALTTGAIKARVRKTVARLLTEDAITRVSSLACASELTEYIAAGSWSSFLDAPALLTAITPRAVVRDLTTGLESKRLTVGYFMGTNALAGERG